MTPYRLSQPFFDSIIANKTNVSLVGAGHFPIEQPGLDQMKENVLSFLKRIEYQ